MPKIDVTLDSRQLQELKKSHHQDILKVTASVDKINKSISDLRRSIYELVHRMESLNDKLDRAVYADGVPIFMDETDFSDE